MYNDDIRKLYLRVIIQLIDDYVNPSPIGANKEEKDAAKLHAQAWFEGNSLDYRLVCDSAGINPSWLRKRVLNSDKSKLDGIIQQFRETL